MLNCRCVAVVVVYIDIHVYMSGILITLVHSKTREGMDENDDVDDDGAVRKAL